MFDKFYSVKPRDLKKGQYFKIEDSEYILMENIRQNGNIIEMSAKELRSNLETILKYNTDYPYDIYVTKLNHEYKES